MALAFPPHSCHSRKEFATNTPQRGATPGAIIIKFLPRGIKHTGWLSCRQAHSAVRWDGKWWLFGDVLDNCPFESGDFVRYLQIIQRL